MNKKTLLVVQISLLILFSTVLGGMIYFTNIYQDVESGIVKVLCLSCIKLQPKTSRDFTFNTANGEQHPDFIINALREKDPILIQYGEPGCAACTRMIDNVMKKYFKIEFEDEKLSFEKQLTVENISFYYMYIYYDSNAPKTEKTESFRIYDKDHILGFPMFTIITIEYHHSGEIKPYYTTLYGEFEDDYKKMYDVFVDLLEFSNELYDRNIYGFK